MKKLPKIFQNEVTSNIKNNKKVYNSLKDNEIKKTKEKSVIKKEKENTKILTVKEKVKELIRGNNYIFNTQVTLVFDDHERECNIAGVVNNHIITMDNEIIKLDDLKDIKY